MTAILGISAFYHDSAAALLVDGEIVAAVQEERFSRRKHDPSFPRAAVELCLAEAGIGPEQLDFVGFYEKPYLTFDRLVETYLAFAPRGYRSFVHAIPVWLREKLHVPRLIRRGLGGGYRKKVVFGEHHESHAASAFFPSPFDEAAILTLDGVGEWATTTIGRGSGNRIELLRELRFPHSIGLLYSAFTYFTGFKVNSGEYKLMGLAPYGEPRFVDVMRKKLIDIREDGSIRVNLEYFNYCQGLTMTSRRMDGLFGGPPRAAESPITQREMDIAASIQVITEEIVLRCARTAHGLTGSKHLCLAGGVALNCVANGRVLREGPFDRIWIQPAAGDAGGALGIASLIWYQLLDNERNPVEHDRQHGSLLGPRYTDEEVRALFDREGVRYQTFDDDESLCKAVAQRLADGKIVGWFQGRMEFGPRALGARSILGDPRKPEMQSVMNLKIKFRESFRPFAPSVLESQAHELFALDEGVESPYMLVVAGVRSFQRDGDAAVGLDKLKHVHSDVPAVTHVDGSARIQTVNERRHGRYYQLLREFDRLTGCPAVVNTSFNVRGEPIVCTPEHAYRCFQATNIDVLAIERTIVNKEPGQVVDSAEVDDYLGQFDLD